MTDTEKRLVTLDAEVHELRMDCDLREPYFRALTEVVKALRPIIEEIHRRNKEEIEDGA